MNSWKEAIGTRRFRIQSVTTILSLATLAIVMPIFFELVIHDKPGIHLNDWVLDRITPKQVSWYIFSLIYSSIFVFGLLNYLKPYKVLFVCQLYSAVTWLRLITIYFFTFEAPQGIIPLTDPFLTLFIYNQPNFVKDLFFSGHVSTLITLALSESNRKFKYAFFILAAITGYLLLLQHVHYTLDVIFAPIFTYSVYFVLKGLTKK